MRTKLFNRLIPALCLLCLPAFGFANEVQPESRSCFSNPLFNTLLIVIIMLLIVNMVLSQALKNIAQSDYLIKKVKEKAEQNIPDNKTLGLFILFSLVSYAAQAQGTTVQKQDWEIGGLGMWTFYSLLTIILFEVIVMIVLLRLIRSLLKPDLEPKALVIRGESELIKKLTGAVAVENEEEIMLEHEYDGIRELDNDLPPWWKYGFYLTVIVAVVYLIHYHVTRTGDLQIAEYTKEVEKGKQEVAEFMKNAADNVDETNVKLLDGAEIESGKQVFVSTCAACHGKLGEGGVGPNLTDEYWIHGGALSEIFKSIKYGWTDKGMKSWKEDLSPVQIAQIASFIRSIKGTNPPNGKAPQGEIYNETNASYDTSGIKKDSVTTTIDTLNNKVTGTKAK